jgi:hypothetical protein
VTSPALANGVLYLGSGFPNSAVMAFEVATGAKLWTAPLDQIAASSPAVAADTVIVGSKNGMYYGLDRADGGVQWTYETHATGGNSAPLVSGAAAAFIADGVLHQVSVAGGVPSAITPLDDPSPVTGATSVDIVSSSLCRAGDVRVALLRFTYAFADAWEQHEVVFAVDDSGGVAWRTELSRRTVTDFNELPPFGFCPSPVSTGAAVACASSLDETFKLLSTSTGLEDSTFAAALDGPCLASPVVANARLYALSRAGTLYTFQGDHAPPGPATGLSPAGGSDLAASPSQLSWNPAGPGATYHVRWTTGTDLLIGGEFDVVVSDSFVACPPLDGNTVYTWGVRVRDALGACGPWSITSFGVNVPPDPPTNFTGTGKHQKVVLSWTASASTNVVGYRLAYGPTGQPLASSLALGNVTTATVTGLANGISYTFEVRALNSINLLSAAVSATVTPVSLITIGSKGYDTLQAAGSAAKSGQTIQLGDDTFTLTSTMSLNSGVTLRGVNAHATRIQATGTFDMVKADKDSAVRLVTLSGGAVGVQASKGGVLVQNCVVRDMSDSGIAVSGGATVVNNTIVHNVNAAVRVTGGGKVSARNNIVQGNGAGFLGKVASTYNDVLDPSNVLFGAGDLHAPVSFLDPASGDYREAPFQPSLDSGNPADDYSLEPLPNGGRINLGAFGNTSLASTQ